MYELVFLHGAASAAAAKARASAEAVRIPPALQFTKQTFLFLDQIKFKNKLAGGAYSPTISPLVHFALSPTTYEKIGHKHFINRLSGQLKPAARRFAPRA